MTKRTPQVSYLKITDFKAIQTVELDGLHRANGSASWVFLTGENGYGKTCLLQAIALGICDISEENIRLFQRKAEGKISTPVPEVTCWIKSPNNKDSGRTVGGDQEDIDDEVATQRAQPLVPITCYGSSRLNIEEYEAKRNGTGSYDAPLYDSSQHLRNIEFELSRWYLKKDSHEEFNAKYESVYQALVKILNLKEIQIDTANSDAVIYVEKDAFGKSFSKSKINELAAGYRSLIALIGDITLNLFEQNKGIYKLEELTGIVIIDELDLHLHPKWQKKLPSLLSEVFPKVQFIASTHSPIPLLGAPEHSVFLKVNRTVEEGVTVERLEDLEIDLPNLLPNAILSSGLFDLELFPITHDPSKPIYTENTYREVKESQALDDELQQLGKDFKMPEIKKDQHEKGG